MDLKVAQAKVQKFGATLSAMVMPNIGVFIGWGLLTALFIPTGWAPNKQLNELVGPILTYLLPALIGYTAGANIYGRRGGVIGAFATLGVIVGSSVTMLVGGMIMGPIGAILLKKFDKLVKGKVKPGMEMLVDNFSLGILGFILVILGFLAIAPIITGIQNFLSAGVNFMTKRDLIPLTSLFVQPAQILFLNNAINHGIMVPLGLQQAAEAGKSILFLVEANGAIWVGTALAFAKFGTGIAKKTAPGAAVIMFFGGIAEVVFPYCLMMPLTILGPMAGNIFSLTVLSLFDGGTVGPPSPGSVFAFYMMTPKSSLLVNSIAYFGALAVSFAVTGLILKFVRQPNASKMLSSFDTAAVATAGPAAPAVSEELQTAEKDDGIAVAPKNQLRHLNRIIFACDAGMGSSAMGASILSAELKKVGLSTEVDHMAVADIGDETSRADLIVTNESLEPRAEMMSKGSLPILTVKNFMDRTEYQRIIDQIRTMVGDTDDHVTQKQAAEETAITPQVAEQVLEKPLFPVENIVLGASFQDKNAAISACADILIEGGYVKPFYKQEMFAREEDLSVYLGDGVAMPHGLTQSDSILHSGICFVQVPDGVDFDGNTAYLLVGVAGKGEEHVQLLGQIAQALTEDNNIQKLREAKDKQTVLSILKLSEH